jgi:hypothetical protein
VPLVSSFLRLFLNRDLSGHTPGYVLGLLIERNSDFENNIATNRIRSRRNADDLSGHILIDRFHKNAYWSADLYFGYITFA